jgi:uncharacterized repeat protein (TIGR01451 family)
MLAPLLLAAMVGLLLPLVAAASHVDPSDLPLTQDEYEALYEQTCGSNPTQDVEDFPPPDSKLATDKNNLFTGEVFDQTADITNIAIWANADDDPKELTLDVSGQRNVINGDAVSRSHLRITASDTIFAHATEYGFRSAGKEAFDMSGEDNCFNLEPDRVNRNAPPDPDSPDGFPFEEQFDPNGDGNILEHFLLGSPAAFPEIATYNAAGKYYRCLQSGFTGGPIDTIPDPLNCDTSSGKISGSASGSLTEGLYVASGEINLSPSGLTAKVTMVSGKQLDVSGSVDSDFFPFHKNLLFASQWERPGQTGTSETDKAEDALKTGGSTSKFTGITVSPNGRNIASGSRNSWTCPIMGDRVTLNGSLLYVSGDECGAPGLTISKIPDGVNADGLSGTVNLGDAIKFKITVTNNGTEDATNVVIDDTLPGTGWSFDGAPPAGCTITGGNVLKCLVGTLPDGNSFSVTVTRASVAGDCVGDTGTGVRVDNGSLTQDPVDDATATADDGLKATDPGHVLVKCPDAGVDKLPDGGAVVAGNSIVFTINITTNGPGPSPNVELKDTLPAGFSWTVGGADGTAANCNPDPPGPFAGGTELVCNFGTIPFPGTRTVTLTAPTTGANCGAVVRNTATITGDGDRVASNNTNVADVTVQCGALRIDKKSDKGNNPFVSGGTDPTPGDTTDNATFTISPNPLNGGVLTVTDNVAPDADPAYGRICVLNVRPAVAPGYSITETKAPKGYLLPSVTTQNSGAVVAPGTCSSGFTLVTFLDPPFGNITVQWQDGGSGETKAKIDCSSPTGALTPDPLDTTPTEHNDTSETYKNLPADTPPILYTCTISADP